MTLDLSYQDAEYAAWTGWRPESPPDKRDAHCHGFDAGYKVGLAVREEPQDRKAIIEALRILQDRTIGSPEANERAVDVLVAGLAAREDTERPERELYLARREPPGMGLNVIDGAHGDEEGVATAAKLHCRIFSPKAGEGPAVMVEVFPVPDLDPPINEDAADACREMLRDTERPDEGDAL